jgi:hypothetical protein
MKTSLLIIKEDIPLGVWVTFCASLITFNEIYHVLLIVLHKMNVDVSRWILPA